jgi:hypothetical protein
MRGVFRGWPALLVAGILALALTGAFRADEKAKDNEDQGLNNKELRRTIRALIKAGARLHNARDYTGSYRYFQGGATTMRTLLGRHPKLQKTLASSLAEAERNPSTSQRCWILYRSLSRVYADLGPKSLAKETENKGASDKKTKTKKAKDSKKKKKRKKDKGKDKLAGKAPKDKDQPQQDKDVPKDLLKDVKKADKDKKEPKLEGAKPPEGKSQVQGKITFKGKPLPAGTIKFVNGKNQAYAANIAAGTYTVKRLPAGEYRVAVTSLKAKDAKKDKGKGERQRVAIPAKYGDVRTSSLTCLVAEGKNEFDIVLAD